MHSLERLWQQKPTEVIELRLHLQKYVFARHEQTDGTLAYGEHISGGALSGRCMTLQNAQHLSACVD